MKTVHFGKILLAQAGRIILKLVNLRIFSPIQGAQKIIFTAFLYIYIYIYIYNSLLKQIDINTAN